MRLVNVPRIEAHEIAILKLEVMHQFVAAPFDGTTLKVGKIDSPNYSLV